MGLANLFGAIGAFGVLVIYYTFVLWGADGFVYWSEVALIGISVIALFGCAASAWCKERADLVSAISFACSALVLTLALLVLFPTIHSRHDSAGFAENMVWPLLPILMLLRNLVLSIFNFRMVRREKETPCLQ
jgi:hypothetical protein